VRLAVAALVRLGLAKSATAMFRSPATQSSRLPRFLTITIDTGRGPLSASDGTHGYIFFQRPDTGYPANERPARARSPIRGKSCMVGKPVCVERREKIDRGAAALVGAAMAVGLVGGTSGGAAQLLDELIAPRA